MKYKSTDVLTTGQVARICNVAPRTVSKWFDSGTLPGYRIPGSRDRRIPFGDLLRFMKANGMPLDGVTGTALCLVVLDSDASYLRTLSSAVEQLDDDVELRTAGDEFLTGILLERHQPDALLVGADGRSDYGETLASAIRVDPQHRKMLLVAMVNDADVRTQARWIQAGFDHCVERVSDVRSLLALVRRSLRSASDESEGALA